jgi:hypothetical protein
MPYSLQIAKDPQARRWREIGTVDQAVRILMYIGGAAFAAFWVISVLLERAASRQPNVATGIYQFPYYHKGHTSYLSAGQASLAHWGDLLVYGWCVAAAAGCWSILSERRAARIRTEMFFSRKGSDGENSDA